MQRDTFIVLTAKKQLGHLQLTMAQLCYVSTTEQQ